MACTRKPKEDGQKTKREEGHLADIPLKTLHAVRPQDEPQLEGAEPPSEAQVPVAVVDHGT